MSQNDTNSRVAEVVWNWRESEVDRTPTNLQLRKRGILPLVALFTVGILFRFVFHLQHMALIPFVLGSILLLITFFIPKWLVSIEAGVMKFAQWVGVAITWILLVPFYYIVFLPLRLIQVLSGKDPMFRKYDPSLNTYWDDRDNSDKKQSETMLKQY